MEYSSREGKDNIGDYYNKVLDSLRKQYDEPETMLHFDEFMQSEGYISIHSDEYRAEYENNSPFTLNGPIVAGFTGAATNSMSIALRGGPAELPAMSHTSNATYQVRSEIKTAYINGQVEYFAESYGTMHANRGWSQEAQDTWQSKSVQVDGLDAKSYLNGVPDGERRAIAGSSDSAGEALAAALAKAGITLSEGESLVLSFPVNHGTGQYFGRVETGRSDINAVINGNPELLSAINSLRDSAPATSLSNVPGQYSDGNRKVSYSQERQLMYSPGNNASVVATDLVNVKASGYTYMKKVSDEFDPSCDSYKITAAGDGYEEMTGKGSGSGKAMYNAFVDDLNRAISEGGTIKSTLTPNEYGAYKAERSALFDDYIAGLPKMRYMTTEDGTVEINPESPSNTRVPTPQEDNGAIIDDSASDVAKVEEKPRLSPTVESMLLRFRELTRALSR
jgi:hypothetical protein